MQTRLASANILLTHTMLYITSKNACKHISVETLRIILCVDGLTSETIRTSPVHQPGGQAALWPPCGRPGLPISLIPGLQRVEESAHLMTIMFHLSFFW